MKTEMIGFNIRADAKEDLRRKVEVLGFTISRLSQATIYNALSMSDDQIREFIYAGEERGVEYEHKKLEKEMQHSEIALIRKKIDIYGDQSIERAIREGYFPDTCSRHVTRINRFCALVFQKLNAGKWNSEKIDNIFNKFRSTIKEKGEILAEFGTSREHAEEVKSFWTELGFTDEEAKMYFLDFEDIELLDS